MTLKIYQDTKQTKGKPSQKSILSAVASRESFASLFPMQERETEQTMIDTSGLKCLGLSESLNRPMSLARMLLASSAWKMAAHLSKYVLIWKMKGTRSNRLLYQLRVSVRGTGETGYGLLLTPTGMDIEEDPQKFMERKKKNGYKNNTVWPSLGSQVKMGMLPTPRAREGNAGSAGSAGSIHNAKRGYLDGIVQEGMLPTPTKGDYKGARQPETMEATGRNPMTNSLDSAIETGVDAKLSPEFVEWLQGFPIGWTDIQNPPQQKQKAEQND